MLKAHSQAYASLRGLYGDAVPQVQQRRVFDIDGAAAQRAVDRHGWSERASDWRAITRADDIDVVDIVTPNDAHAQVAIDAARHGKHVVCEKPLAHDLRAAQEMLEAVRDAGVLHQVGFVYRKWPAVRLAKRLVAEGAIGPPREFRGHYFHDYAADPGIPLGWRGCRARAGAGSVGDIGSHVIDIARYLVGEVTRVVAQSRTHVTRRPSDGTRGRHVDIDVDDATSLLVQFESGASGVIEASWAATGYKTDLRFEVTGDDGALRFSWQRLNELDVYLSPERPDVAGFRSVVIGPQHAGADAFWPVPGQGMGWGDLFVLATHDLVQAIAGGRPVVEPSFEDGIRAMAVVAAAQESAAGGRWVTVRATS
jgi:predicted dehydrogenase